MCMIESCTERRASLRNEIAILQKALTDSINQNDKVSKNNKGYLMQVDLYFVLFMQLTEEVYALRDERDELQGEVTQRDQTIKELSGLMGLAHFSSQNGGNIALQNNNQEADGCSKVKNLFDAYQNNVKKD